MTQLNPNLYTLIHELVVGESEESRERRCLPRTPYDARQRVARRDGPGIPDDSEFHEVRCHDISQSGFAFLFPTRPAFQSLVVAFGLPPTVIYVAAEVAHCTRALVFPSGRVKRLRQSLPAGAVQAAEPDSEDAEGRPMILVGCRFRERLYPS